LIKRATHQEDIRIVNIYTPNVSAHNFIKQILMDIKVQIDSSMITMHDFNRPFSSIDKSCRQKYQQGNFRIK
jgi:hypothetical protein